ncbi:uncharacterized protein NECHADRAFT_98244 [Fusarium vanettenii 77-13-4]|uniref:Fumarylacetoacetase-like C-terminal domain-containing protein n=1 Tax=Fusarium vanettenii (strain ATCC MYA-4622 / CBS 123669 / FGSC 9596 / NRRL 45880 / 77-13-4) TaxID=660122 RepID=C7ZGU4_FUSV7|nr:uncharacterized protein NECHADRAFT_98244 [Fusarium vanettenii 77-13-4]EEU36776.1 hypothetical protein NECHADRAFT_98244 [Fusarium vanettenii 77-13-4]
MSFDRLIRFLDKEGIERYGNVEGEIPASELEGKTVQLVSGSIESGFKVLDEKAELVKLLCPLPSTPIIICAGVNYKSHAKETKFPPPKKPVIFAITPDRLAGLLDDYEGELSVVISKDGYDISEDDALDYVLGYTISNDVSARNLHAIDSFDDFGPTGPYLVSPKLVPDPQALDLKTTVNGELIAFASRGRTLRRGTVIMTGTPEGVGWHTNGCLKDGDVVEVSIGGLGFIRNKMVFHRGA